MNLAFSATNPCHLYPLARELAELGEDVTFYSGYPRWRLPDAEKLRVRPHSLRTLVTYALLRTPERWRPRNRDLFVWQDTHFDRWAGRVLEPCDEVHAMPGQCLATFQRAHKLGLRTVLNHATGPVREWVKIMSPEYARIGRRLELESRYDAAYFAREEQEYALADKHCAASTIVRDQLVAQGIAAEDILVVPYGADPAVFHSDGASRPDKFTIVVAGQLSVRKGIHHLLRALSESGRDEWEVHFYGGVLDEVKEDLAAYRGAPKVHFHGAVDQAGLADAFRAASVLVLASLEEGFGLVVPQALSCGLPCVVSDRVGAKDLVRPRENGSIFASGEAGSLLDELKYWESHPAILQNLYTWKQPAQIFLANPR